jgi:hypothetical protein
MVTVIMLAGRTAVSYATVPESEIVGRHDEQRHTQNKGERREFGPCRAEAGGGGDLSRGDL